MNDPKNVPPPPPKLVDVAVGAILRPDGRLLLGQRPQGKPYAGWWELPGGKLEPGETVLEALARELDEELGIAVTHATPWVTHVHAYQHATVRLFFCRVTGWHGEPHSRESQALEWVAIEPATAAQAEAARHALAGRLAALETRRERGDTPTELETAQASVPAPEDAVGLTVVPPIGPMLPATLPALRWLSVPDRYAITAISSAENIEGFLHRCEAALAAGLKLVQFREPAWPEGPHADSLHRVFRRLLALTRAAGARLLVNSVHPQAWWREADGVHLRAVDLAHPRPELAPGAWLAVSAHDAGELARARELDADLAVLGPVLPTDSHPGAATLGWEGFADLALHAGLPVFALGGQSAHTRDDALRQGAHGTAGIRGFW